MPRNPRRCQPVLEGLETRVVLSGVSTGVKVGPKQVGPLVVVPGPPGVGMTTGPLAVLEAFSKSYLSYYGEPAYNPAFDFNHNGQIGQTDAKILLHALPPIHPKAPLFLKLTIAPQDKVKGHAPATNLGGFSPSMNPVILGHTNPGTIIFTGSGTVDWKLRSAMIVPDANGNFSLTELQADGINQLDFLVVSRYGQQLPRSFPIYWTGFARYQAEHPRYD